MVGYLHIKQEELNEVINILHGEITILINKDTPYNYDLTNEGTVILD